ncbi:uncharacterized protein [Rutidosis leptorrhynchoides]|uniref:uncharacterized protein n=1 Tax=Rutidosis leptorrhynchoides TaxID=125765 RepID=UPI003A994227
MGWMFLTISETLLERLLNSQPKTSYQAWEFLKNIFQDNKRFKIVELTAELRSITVGDLMAEAYFQKIDSIASMLQNLGSTMKDEELVTYAINGLNNRFPHATHIILHSEPFPNLNTVRSMITLEEMQLQRQLRGSIDSPGTPSAPTALMAQIPANAPSRSTITSPQVCRNFSRGHCRFGEKCRYIHQGNHASRSGNHMQNTSGNRTTGNNQTQLLNIIAAQQHLLAQQHLNRSSVPSIPGYGPRTHLAQFSGPPGFPASPQAHYIGLPASVGSGYLTGPLMPSPQFNGYLQTGPAQINTGQVSGPAAHTVNGPAQITPGQSQFTVGPTGHTPFALTAQPSQETLIPNDFAATTLPDYGNSGWTMDTCVSTHLTSSINNFSTVFNHCIYPSVAVGDGNSIPVTNTGYSMLPNIHRPLHLSNVLVTPNIVKNHISVRRFTRDNKVSVTFDEFGFSVKDYLTRRLLLRCDSSRDLYPLTPQSPPTAHQALVTTPSIWHQRLGHPSTDTFRRLISNNSIVCNNTKSPILCHACQLGKYVRLPFSSSVSHVTSLFDIVHSDLWTSPIPSLSGYKYYVLFLDHYSHYLWIFPLRNKWRPKVTAIDESKNAKKLTLDELIGNLKVHEVILDKDDGLEKVKREKNKSIALKAKIHDEYDIDDDDDDILNDDEQLAFIVRSFKKFYRRPGNQVRPPMEQRKDAIRSREKFCTKMFWVW